MTGQSLYQTITLSKLPISISTPHLIVSHTPKLLLKLTSYRIKGNLYFWIDAFLTNHHQKVKINSTFFYFMPFSSSVPQEYVLGPLLFNLFINDVTDLLDVSTTTKLFADDIKLYSSFSTVSPSNLQSRINLIELWASVCQLQISHSKCNVLVIGSSSSETLNANAFIQVDNAILWISAST